jgi:hypothetical protein
VACRNAAFAGAEQQAQPLLNRIPVNQSKYVREALAVPRSFRLRQLKPMRDRNAPQTHTLPDHDEYMLTLAIGHATMQVMPGSAACIRDGCSAH